VLRSLKSLWTTGEVPADLREKIEKARAEDAAASKRQVEAMNAARKKQARELKALGIDVVGLDDDEG
jgi:hypothetical protein